MSDKRVWSKPRRARTHRSGSGPPCSANCSLTACSEWLWSGWPVRHPDLKVAMSEEAGGIGWVAMLVDRLDNVVDQYGYGEGSDEHPADVLRRNFWFCTLDDPSTIDTRHTIGVDRIMVEVDYPHGDGTWPNTQDVIEQAWGHIPEDELRQMCSGKAAKLYRHPLPERVLPDSVSAHSPRRPGASTQCFIWRIEEVSSSTAPSTARRRARRGDPRQSHRCRRGSG